MKTKNRNLATNVSTDIIGLLRTVMSSSFTHHPPHSHYNFTILPLTTRSLSLITQNLQIYWLNPKNDPSQIFFSNSKTSPISNSLKLLTPLWFNTNPSLSNSFFYTLFLSLPLNHNSPKNQRTTNNNNNNNNFFNE